MKKFNIVVMAISMLMTLSATLHAAEPSGQSQSIINKFEPARAIEEAPEPEIPIYSSKAELLQDIKDGNGLFYSVRALGIFGFRKADDTEDGRKLSKLNTAFAKSVKLIIETEYGTPLAISFDLYPNGAQCGFAENLAFVSHALLNYMVDLKLKVPDFRTTTFAANHKIDESRGEFDKCFNYFKKCETTAGNDFEPIGVLVGEMAEALAARTEVVKAKRREYLGYTLSEGFLVSQVIETDGTSASPDLLTSVEGFLGDLSSKATFNKWVVKGDSYTLNALYGKAPLIINMVNLPEKGVTTVEGTLNKKKLQAKDIINLMKIVRVN